MPTYDYHCEKCDRTFELFQSMKDPVLKNCPKEACQRKTWGKGKVKRLLGTGAGLIFKGSGFYITDYRSEGYRQSAKNESTASSTAKAEAKTEAKKPEAASSSKSKPGKK